MHLLECIIALQNANRAARWHREAEHVARLCRRSFLHSDSGALLEYFDANMTPISGVEGRVVERDH